MSTFKIKSIVACAALAMGLLLGPTAQADETIKLGMSYPLTGAAAPWGLGSEWMCNKAVNEIEAAGGIDVNGTTYNFECLVYDNKYSAAGGCRLPRPCSTEMASSSLLVV